ncbi:Na+/H+ antiporter subunit E [Pseudotabrizicola alkalilacus]|uniref:Na+/H+ antiporter subunit E n=1 Tax=Pseudotabrizicola alkalilacus TaxID=2305252 RepID=A0A411Z103_9RHOB|nr:Na+/H+ antiporter subunit E [Pseudotabrizicola alkalilacus]RGP36736.1 Na+/H+ antiporter subunit E [Pseudotabrizicola alkalilacus]
MLRRLFPHPLLSMLLFATWILLVNQIKVGSIVMALILATLIPMLTAPYWPNRPPLKKVPAFAAYVLLVMWDIVLANIQVARIVLFMRNENIRSGWLAIPIDLKTPEAITILAGTITMTPGTVTSDMSSCGRVLLIHALHAPDPDAVIHDIKTRYEARLKRIFE